MNAWNNHGGNGNMQRQSLLAK